MSKTKILGLIIVIVGALVVLSPNIMNEVTDFQMNEKINEFIEETKNVEYKDELFERLKEYNENLYKNGQHIVDAFSYEDVSIDLRKYRI